MKKNKEKYKINRNRYHDIKRYDHGTMEEYLTQIYMQGAEKGVKEYMHNIKTEITEPDYSVVKTILSGIKGIGEKKADMIIKELEEKYVITCKNRTTETKNNKDKR